MYTPTHISFFIAVLWQGDFYPDYFSLRAKNTLHLSRIVILFSEREFFLLLLLIELILPVVKNKIQALKILESTK